MFKQVDRNQLNVLYQEINRLQALRINYFYFISSSYYRKKVNSNLKFIKTIHIPLNQSQIIPQALISAKNCLIEPLTTPLLRQLFIYYHYNFQMCPSKQHFLFLLIFIFIVRSQVLNPLTNCLGNCMHCAPADLSLCKGTLSCEWGYYINSSNGTCALAPSKELVWTQLGERTDKNTIPISESWGDSTKQIACEYNSPSGKKYIDALGLFGGVTMLQKTFAVNNNSQLFELSFNLLRDEWMPFNDFLLIDISSKDNTLQSLQISFEKRIKVESQQTPILCGNKRVISEKYNIKIHNNNDIGNSLTVVFTSFLYLSQWGLSNIKLLSACTQFSLYDQNTESCTICDTDSYLATLYDGEKMCDKCPSLCKTCSSMSNCTTCLVGAILTKNGTCSFSSNSKTQQIASITHNLNTCNHHQFYMGNSANKITFSQIKNEGNLLYDEIQLHFGIYYQPMDWLVSDSDSDKISIRINKVEVFSLNKLNFTNKGTISCRAFKSNATAVISILTPHKIQNDNSINLEIEYIGKRKDVQFGVSEVKVISPQKEVPKINISIPIAQDRIIVPEIKPVIDIPVQNITVFPKIPDDQMSKQGNSSLVVNITEPPNNIINSTDSNRNSTNSTIPINQTADSSENVQNMTHITSDRPLIVINQIPDIEQNKIPQKAIQVVNQLKNLAKNQSISQIIQQKKPTISPIIPTASQDSANKAIPTEIQQGQPEQSAVSSEAAYIPTSNNDHSGLHVVISNIPSLANSSLKVDIDKLDPSSYELTQTYIQENDLHLFIAIDSSFIDGKMTVYKVTSSRLLQTASKGNSQVIAVVNIDRFDSLSSNQLLSISTFSIIFQIFAWVGVVSIIIATLSGYGVVVEEYVISLQLLFLHVYIAADYLPLTFRDVIGGLNRVQNLNFMIYPHGAQIEKSWLGNVIQNGPIKFFLFNTDINFTREFYPIIIINIAYTIWFIGLFLTKRFLFRQDLIDQEKPAIYRLIENIVCRPINYLDQIWRYQFLATMWCCFIQFYNLTYPEGSNRSEVLNALLCVLALVCSLGWPVFLANYSRKYFYENEYSDFLYRFEDVYFGRIHECFLPSSHTRIGFPIVRSAKLLLSAIIIAYLGNIASLTLLLLVGLQIFEVGYAKHHEIFIDHKYFAHRLIENVLFALIQLILFFLCTFSSLALTESYVYIGFVLSGMALVIVVNSVARAVHLGCQKYKKMFEDMDWEPDQMEKPKTERIV